MPRTLAVLALAASLAASACRDRDGAGEGPPAAAAPGERAATRPVPAQAVPALETVALDVPSESGLAPAPSVERDPDASPLLSWLEVLPDGGHALSVARLGREGFEAPARLVAGGDLLANWADVPRTAVLDEGTLAAVWIVRPYELRVAFHPEGGPPSDPIVPHRGTAREFGFPAPFFVPAKPGDGPSLGLAWIQDGTVRATIVRPQGADPPVVLDDRTCECCRIAAAAVGDVTVLAYRDRSPDEIRDTAVVRLPAADPKAATAPRIFAPAAWRIAGCPVNGPVLVRAEGTLALARFDGRDGGRVDLLFSKDAGRSFGAPVVVEAGRSLGRSALAPVGPGEVAVAWLSPVAGAPGRAHLLARRVHATRGAGPVRRVATTTAGRDSGFPVLVRHDDRLVFVWTEPDADGTPHLAARSAPLSSLPGPA